ncbi:MAG: hypothetical protein WBX95_15365, partial [Xanthobacteraceae bacterium]
KREYARPAPLARRKSFRKSSGSFATPAAILRASSLVSSFAADPPPRLLLEIGIRAPVRCGYFTLWQGRVSDA